MARGRGACAPWAKLLDCMQEVEHLMAEVDRRQASFPGDTDPVIAAYKEHVDRTLVRENLKRTPWERLQNLYRFGAFIEKLRRAAKEKRRD